MHMTSDRTNIRGVSSAGLPLSGGGSLRFVTLRGDGESPLPGHAELLLRGGTGNSLWAGPEVYGSSAPDLSGVPAAGHTLFLGTRTGAPFYRGMQACLVSGARARVIEARGSAVGVRWEDEFAEYALLGGLLPRDLRAGRYEQTLDVFRRMEEALRLAGMDFSHVVRTWFYNDRLLDWYDEFNRARDAFFAGRGVFGGLVPASTGIGSANRAGAALQARALGVRPKNGGVRVAEVPSPLQCPAQDYRSSFSRAVELEHPLFRQLIVSGTASIAPGGETVHVNEIERQIGLSLDVIEAILESRGMGWKDVVRAVAYLKDESYEACYRETARRRGLERLPCISVQADVCRGDLLFEMELDAAVVKAG